jgi:hypothetical protein
MTPRVRRIYRNFIMAWGFLGILFLSLHHFMLGYLFVGLFLGMIAGDCSAPFVVEEDHGTA